MNNRIVAGAQDLMTPLWQAIASGRHLNRNTFATVECAGLRVRTVHQRIGGLFVGIDAEVETIHKEETK